MTIDADLSLDLEMPDIAAGDEIALDFAVDQKIFTLVGTAIPGPDGNGLQPMLTADAEALAALSGGRRASIAVPQGTIDFHLSGSSNALRPVIAACRGGGG